MDVLVVHCLEFPRLSEFYSVGGNLRCMGGNFRLGADISDPCDGNFQT
jgi:hypothetical protein